MFMEFTDCEVVVGIDFGTTHSGLAFAHIENPKRIDIKRNWRVGNNNYLTGSKVPTVLFYDDKYKHVQSFAKESNSAVDQKPIELFKLHLQNTKGPPLPDGLDLKKVITDYFRELCRSALRFDTQALIILTVPTEFDNNAIEILREGILKAGLLKDHNSQGLMFITEVEAAVVHCMDSLDDNLPVDTTFIVVDCSHCKVNVTTIRHEIIERRDVCGSSLIDQEFIKFLELKVGSTAMNFIKESRQFRDIIENFHYVKRSFTGSQSGFRHLELEFLEFRLHSAFKQIIKLKFEDVKEMFDSVIGKIIRLISSQLHLSDTCDCSALFLVGGFSESAYLQSRIKEKFSKRVSFIIIPPHPNVAVMKGAVKYGLRKLQEHYRFREGKLSGILHLYRIQRLIRQLERQIHDHHNNVISQRLKDDEIHKSNNKFSRRVQQLERQINDHQNKIKLQEQNIDQLQQSLELKENQIKGIEKQHLSSVQQFERQISDHQNKIELQEQNIDQLQQSLELKENQIKEIEEQHLSNVQQLERQISDHQNKIELQEQNIDQLQQSLELKENQIKGIEKQHLSDVQQFERQISDHQNKIKLQEQNIDQLQQSLKLKENEVQESNNDSNQHKLLCNKLQEDISNINQQHQNKTMLQKQEIDQLHQLIQNLEKEKGELNAEKNNFHQENINLENQLENFIQKYVLLEGEGSNYQLEDSITNLNNDIARLNDNLKTYITDLKQGVVVNIEEVEKLLLLYKCPTKITNQKNDQLLIQAVLQRHIMESVFSYATKYFQSTGQHYHLESDIVNKAYSLSTLLTNTSKYRTGNEDVTRVALTKLRQHIYLILNDCGFTDIFGDDNSTSEHPFIVYHKEQLNQIINELRTIKDDQKKIASENLAATIIREIIKMFWFRFKIQESVVQYVWIPYNTQVDKTYMEGNDLDDLDDNVNLYVDLCYFPLIGRELKSNNRKVFTSAKVFINHQMQEH